ncbi:hypothetical protein OH77DRAFT_1495841 [Trametes cingulata]|nr:hypothetical protein OH77DRAFT_1495841 [Trametes cingulata]
MSFLFRLLRRLRSSRGFVGRDLEGNQYFEYPNVHGDSRPRRIVKYAEGRDMWEYVGGQKRLPVQWTAWLAHTRPHPPTLEELQGDLERQRRILFNVALIEAREREEAARIAASQQPAAPHLQEPPVQTGEPAGEQAAPERAEERASQPGRTESQQAAERSQPPAGQPSPWKPPPPDEPHSWQPRASVRRGG